VRLAFWITSLVVVATPGTGALITISAGLAQFVPAGAPDQLASMLKLSAVFMAMTFVVFAIYGACAAAMRRHVIDRPEIVRRIRQAFAASFLALTAKLATTER
jgi:threonine/homoserine/homoserine lactone efflux protein